MGVFGPSYVFIPLGFFFIRIMGILPPQEDGRLIFCVRSEGGVDEGRGVLYWRTLIGNIIWGNGAFWS